MGWYHGKQMLEGDVPSALNISSVHGCPTSFYCRNNGYAISTHTDDQYKSDGIAPRGIALLLLGGKLGFELVSLGLALGLLLVLELGRLRRGHLSGLPVPALRLFATCAPEGCDHLALATRDGPRARPATLLVRLRRVSA